MSPEIQQAFEAAGRRVTFQRRMVVQELERSQRLLSAEQVHDRLKREHPEVSLSTIYRTLDLLEKLGVARRKSFGDGRARYGLCAGCSRQHARCRSCGAIVEFDEALSDYLVLQLERDSGFVAHSCELTLHGRCPSCATRELARTVKR